MRIKLNITPNEKQLWNRNCRFGIDDELVFSDSFGINTTFIGTLRKTETDSEYLFSVDRIERGCVQSLQALDSKKKSDLRYLKLALEHDYGLTPEEYEIVQ